MAKVPPPPQLTGPEWQLFNRWLLELTAILDASGGVDPTQIPGYGTLQTQVAQNTSDIQTAELNISSLAAGQGTQGTAVASLQNRMTTAEGNITTLAARAQVLNGAAAPTVADGLDGDWWAKTSAPTHIYVKVAGAWVTIV